MNALKHGLTARTAVLPNEDRREFEALRQAHLDRFQPADPVESHIVHILVMSQWRQRRLWKLESSTIENQMASCSRWVKNWDDQTEDQHVAH
jgi:hypothetical protein